MIQMDTSAPSQPMQNEKEKFLKKIQEWRALGFDTSELEGLLDNDFDEFLHRRHEILKEQVAHDKTLEEAYLASQAELPPEHIETTIREPYISSEPEPSQPDVTTEVEDDELLLLGEPLPPEDETILEEDDESVIFVGKFQRTPKSRVHKSRVKPDRVSGEVQEVQEVQEAHEEDFLDEPEPRDRSKKKPGARRRTAREEEDTEAFEEPGNEFVGAGEDEADERSGRYDDYDESDEYDEYEDYDEDEDEDKDEEEDLHDHDDEYEDDEEEEGVRRRPRRVGGRGRREEEPTSGFGKVIAAVVAIIVILAAFYLFFDFPTGTEPVEEVNAIFEISPILDKYEAGSLITLDATSSTGDDLEYSWDPGSDFKVYDGSIKNKKFIGYYSATDNSEKTQSITLEIKGKGGSDSVTKKITVKPRSFSITGEKLGDYGEYKVTGNLMVTNTDGIQEFKVDDENTGIKADVKLTNVNLDFKTRNTDPMTLELKSVNNNVNDGFLQGHSVFQRDIDQNLDLSGKASGKADVRDTGSSLIPRPRVPVPFTANLDGNMNTIDNSYTDLRTYNTIYGAVDSDMDLTATAQIEELEQFSMELSFSSDDKLESYPYLQKSPSNLRLVDLPDEDGELSIGDQDGITVGDVLYIWNAQKIEYIFDRPVIKVNLTLAGISDDSDLKIEKFFFAVWIAEDISIPIKTHLFSEQKYKDNETSINYVSTMTDFTEGTSLISNDDCTVSTPDGHFYKKHPDYSYYPSSNWSYLPPTGTSNKSSTGETSFDDFTAEQAIQLARTDNLVQSYLSSNPSAYVVVGYCTARGDTNAGVSKGVLHWNLTFGYKDKGSTSGLRVITTIDGPVLVKEVTIDEPVNSTSDFESILSFGSAEDIFNDQDLDFYDYIFDSESMVDFESVTFGVRANLQYPNLDLTSIMFVESSRYAYLVTLEKNTGDGQQVVNIALDAETGQLLYFFDHTDNGFNIFQT